MAGATNGTKFPLRMVLVGKSGVGKSASGNTILGRKAFEEDASPNPVTMTSTCQSAEIDGRKVSVIDTPGLFSTSMYEEKVKEEFHKCILRSVPGPHAFLLVVRLGRFTQDEKSAVQCIQEHFGEAASQYTLVLFTGADQIKKKSLDEFLSPSKEIQDLIDYCGSRYHAFNNEDEQNLTQVPELMQKIEEMVKKNGGKHYTTEMYKEAEIKMKEEEERRKTAEEWEARKKNLKGFAVGAVSVGAIGVGVTVAMNPATAEKMICTTT